MNIRHRKFAFSTTNIVLSALILKCIGWLLKLRIFFVKFNFSDIWAFWNCIVIQVTYSQSYNTLNWNIINISQFKTEKYNIFKKKKLMYQCGSYIQTRAEQNFSRKKFLMVWHEFNNRCDILPIILFGFYKCFEYHYMPTIL